MRRNVLSHNRGAAAQTRLFVEISMGILFVVLLVVLVLLYLTNGLAGWGLSR